MPASPARTAAFHILLRVEQAASYASELLHSSPHAGLSIADHGLTTELVMGVLRWRSLLDASIGRVSSQQVRKLDVEVLTALRLGAYQLGWLDRVPARAAIHESVELVKSARKRSAAPFVNAVLRKLADSSASLQATRTLIESSSSAEALAAASAHPEWFVQRWTSELGLDVTRHICGYDQLVPPTVIRLRMPSPVEELRAEGIELEGGDLLANARRVFSGDVTKTKAFAEGRVAIQDEASQLVAALVGKGSRILDCCAAPGGKTWAIADRNPQSTIVAAELHPHRAETLRKRVGARNVEVIVSDILELPVGELFDRVLVDVPCSGTGTLARHPEIKWRLKPSDLSDLHLRQAAILRAAMNHVASGGKLIYSTCSLEPEENETVVEERLRANQSFRLIDVSDELKRLRENGELIAEETSSLVRGSCLHTTPGVQRCDGFFAAVLERQAY
jgi:16S rRNA (cytosine967-C5)-methyltransferase